ncbi:4-hydroxybenzoate polyprenyltransferase [hydrothermal vent metagenome]|uniref:4-hydroxybenzoate polyprenyltransferase n=1 Tax=hydrothermal vent metagenome TaxID=652676 RepID=A0A3B0U7J6_9ZZZZ
MPPPHPEPSPPADTVKGHWVDRTLPSWARPYARLARLDRPIGTWLLMWPCLWGVALASAAGGLAPDWRLLLAFAIGAMVMRGAGCTFNDIVDRDIDARVKRTASRPLPSGQVSLTGAWVFLVGQCLVGLAVLVQFNTFTILLGLGSLVLVAIYPFMKRFTYWPQVFLGLAFNWGALMGWSAVTGTLATPAILLYLAGILWTLGYDTIYAHQDKEDDILIGVKSTALRFGAASRIWIAGFYGGFIILGGFSFSAAGLGWPAYAGLAATAAHLGWQVAKLDIGDGAGCLTLFRANRDTGAWLFAGLVLSGALAGGSR